MKHTPGPWTNLASASRLTITNDKYIPLATCFDAGGLKPEECQANARLIAAAPELLEALKNLISFIAVAPFDDPLDVAYKEAEKAIAKAEGRD